MANPTREGEALYGKLAEALAPLLSELNELDRETVQLALYAFAGGNVRPRAVSDVAFRRAGRIALVRAGLDSSTTASSLAEAEDNFELLVGLLNATVDRLQEQLDWERLEAVATDIVGRRKGPRSPWFTAWELLVRWNLEVQILPLFGVDPDQVEGSDGV